MSQSRVSAAEVRSGSAFQPVAPPAADAPSSPPAALPRDTDIRAGGPYYGPGVKRLVVPPLPPALRLRPPVSDVGRPNRTCGMMNVSGIEGIFAGPGGMTVDLRPPMGRSPGDSFRASGRMMGINIPSERGTWTGSGGYTIHPSDGGCSQLIVFRGTQGELTQYRILGATRDEDGRIDSLQLGPTPWQAAPNITLRRQ